MEYSKINFIGPKDNVPETVDFEDIGIGTFFTDDRENIYQKTSKDKALCTYDNGNAEYFIFHSNSPVWICDVELKWRIR